MRFHAVTVSAVASLVVAGCAALPEARPDLPDGKVAATDEQAARFFDRYDEVNNAANAERDAEAIATTETGPLLETSVTAYELAEANADEPPEPYYHTDVAAYSPRFTEYPMWFVATSRINSDPYRVAVQAVSRDSAAGEWVVEQAGTLGQVELPEIRLVDGATREVNNQQSNQVAIMLEQVYAYLAGGDAPDNVDLTAAGLSTYREWSETSTIQLDEVGEPEIACQTDNAAPVRVLPTVDGVLGVATGRCVLRQSLIEDVPGEMTLGGDLSALAPEPGRSVEFVSSHPLVVSVPEDGPAVAYSGGWRWADVTMSPE